MDAAIITASVELWKTLEAIAACLREEGLKAVTQRGITLLPNRIGIVYEKERKGFTGTFKSHENSHTLFLADGEIAIYKGVPNNEAEPIATIPLADPEAFTKIKQALQCQTRNS